ncbi:MAG: hypothetical protein HZC40_25720, partial [Chloroflexi bacterium]|nr:hypothetical protein [Chloroflexota bacterium]
MAIETNPPARRDIFPGLISAGILIITLAWLFFGGGMALLAQIDIVAKWLAVIALMVFALGWIGHANTSAPGKPGRWLGILIDSSYRMSLSRLQITLWTVVALSAWLVIVLPRLLGGAVI